MGCTQAVRWSDTQWGGLKKGHATSEPRPVFARIECDWVTQPTPVAAAGQPGGKKEGKQQQQQLKKQKQQKQEKQQEAVKV